MQKKKPSRCIECKLVVGNNYGAIRSIWCRITTQSCEDPYQNKNKHCPLELISNKSII